jgi:DNA-binding GntR family transcriptional regulator
MEASPFTPIRTGLLAIEVRRQLRERILDGTLKPAEAIKDSLIAESMQISRSPVREALGMLEQSGLLVKTPNRSYQVISFTESDVEELTGLRIAYESMAVKWLVNHRADVSSLEPLLHEMIPADATLASDSQVVRADGRFHIALVELTGLPRLMGSYSALRDQIAVMVASGFGMQRELINTQEQRHRALFELLNAAIQTGDERAVLRELTAHITAGMTTQGPLGG